MMHLHEEIEAGNPHLTCSQPEMTIKSISLISCNTFKKETMSKSSGKELITIALIAVYILKYLKTQ